MFSLSKPQRWYIKTGEPLDPLIDGRVNHELLLPLNFM